MLIQSGAIANPRLSPIWFTAVPSARSSGLRYMALSLPVAGTPADSPVPNAALHITKPVRPLLNPVATAAVDHQLTAAVIPRFTPTRSKNHPAINEVAA